MRRALLITLATLLGCDDPPGFGGIALFAERSNLRPGLETIGLVVNRVDLYYEGDGPAPPFVGDETICNAPNRTEAPGHELLVIDVPLNQEGRTRLGSFFAPPGKITDIRLLFSSTEATFEGKPAELETEVECDDDDDDSSLEVVRILPKDGEPFEVVEALTTSLAACIDVQRDIRPEDDDGDDDDSESDDDDSGDDDDDSGDDDDDSSIELILSSTLEAVVFEPDGVILNQVVVRFEDGTAEPDILDAISSNGYTVQARWRPSNYYTLQPPDGTSLEDALRFWNDVSSVRYVLPNTVLNYSQNDPQFPNQVQWPQVSLDQVYTGGNTGDLTPVVAIVDSGVRYDHPDLINNIFINIGELPAVLTNDNAPADGFMDADFDQDGLITFTDWNAPALTPAQLAILAAAGLTPPLTPTVLIATLSDGVDDDDFDGDPATFIDDLCGWDFGAPGVGANTPLPDFASEGVVAGHGTWVAGTAAAVGNNNTDITGSTYQARILPIRAFNNTLTFGDSSATGPVRDSVYRSFAYAAALGADVINASLGGYVIREGAGNCSPQIGVYDLDSDKYDAFEARLDLELADMHQQRGTSLLVVAAGNCGINHDSGGVYAWPSEQPHPSMVVVGGVDTSDNLSSFSDTGAAKVDIAAPAEDFIMLNASAGIGATTTCVATANDCDGTSFAAPMVSGTAALLISTVPALQGNPCNIADRIIRNGDSLAALQNVIGINGFRLNALRAINNTVVTPIRGCP